MASFFALTRRGLFILAIPLVLIGLLLLYAWVNAPRPLELEATYLHPRLMLGMQAHSQEGGASLKEYFWVADRDSDGVPELGLSWHALLHDELADGLEWLEPIGSSQYPGLHCLSPISGETLITRRGTPTELGVHRALSGGLMDVRFADQVTGEEGPYLFQPEDAGPSTYKPFDRWLEDSAICGPWEVEWSGNEIIVTERETKKELARHSLQPSSNLIPVGMESFWHAGIFCFASADRSYGLQWIDLSRPEDLQEFQLQDEEWPALQALPFHLQFGGMLSKEGHAQVLVTRENGAVATADLLTLGESVSREPLIELDETQRSSGFDLRSLVMVRDHGGVLLVIPQEVNGATSMKYLVQTPFMKERREKQVDFGRPLSRAAGPSCRGFAVPDQDGDSVPDYLVSWSSMSDAVWMFLSGATGEVIAR